MSLRNHEAPLNRERLRWKLAAQRTEHGLVPSLMTNLDEDPYELRNLKDDPGAADRLRALLTQLTDWNRALGRRRRGKSSGRVFLQGPAPGTASSVRFQGNDADGPDGDASMGGGRRQAVVTALDMLA
jgi:hypothetical protein